MAVVRYRRYLRLLKLWPVQSEHRSRFIPTLDQHLAQRVNHEFEDRPATEVPDKDRMSDEDCDRNLDSLERLMKNTYREMYPRSKENEIGILGLQSEEARSSLDNNFEQVAKRKDRISTIRSLFKMPNKEDKSEK